MHAGKLMGRALVLSIIYGCQLSELHVVVCEEKLRS